MKPSLLHEYLRTVIRSPAHLRTPILISGHPGVGKTATIRSAAVAENNAVWTRHAAILDPIDAGGQPWPEDGKMTHFRPDVMPPEDCGPTVFFLDDLDKAPPAVQNSLLQLVLEREVHGHKMADNVTIVAAANMMTDKSHSSRMSAAFMSRFQHITFEHDLDDWCRWAMGAGIPIEIVAFLRFRSDLFYTFDPKSPEPTFAGPRTWEMVGATMTRKHSSDVEREAICGSIGNAVGTEFMGFLQVWQKMPRLDDILKNPKIYSIDHDPATMYAICGGLARKVTRDNIGQIITYADRLTSEFGVFLVSSATRHKPDIQNTSAFVLWAKEHESTLV